MQHLKVFKVRFILSHSMACFLNRFLIFSFVLLGSLFIVPFGGAVDSDFEDRTFKPAPTVEQMLNEKCPGYFYLNVPSPAPSRWQKCNQYALRMWLTTYQRTGSCDEGWRVYYNLHLTGCR